MKPLPLLLLIPVATSCTDAAPPAASAEPAQAELATRVGMEPARAAEKATALTVPAEVILPPGARAALGPPVEGRLVEWRVALGDTVGPGAPLAEMLSADLADLVARERELQGVVRARQRVLRARRQDVSAGLRTADVVQDARQTLEEARAQLTRLQQELATRRNLAAQDATDADGGRWIWRAGSSGVVEALTCAAGTVHGPETPCLTVADTPRALLRVPVPERHLAALGDSPELEWVPAADERHPVLMRLVRLDPGIDPLTRSRDLYFRPVGDTVLLPGATGRASLRIPARDGVVRVPRGAVTELSGEQVIFVESPEAGPPAIPLPVQVEGRFEGDLLVRGEGLSPGRLVAVRGVFLLKSTALLASE